MKGVIGANPIAQLIKRGKLNQPLEELYDEMVESIRWTRKNAPQLRTIFVRSDIFSNGGANAVQEVAYTFAIAVEYIREMQKRGIDIHDIAQSLQFAFNTGATFYIEIAKLRAARQVWSNIMKAFGAEEKDRSCKIHARPAMFTKTIFDIGVNMLRETTQIFSAVVGGVDSYEMILMTQRYARVMNSPAVSQETYTLCCRKNSACFVRSIRPAVPGGLKH